MTRRILAIISAAIISSVLSVAANAKDFPKGSPKFVTDYNTALAAAKKADKPVLVVFSAVWCPPCQANKRNVYPSAAVKQYHEKFIWAYLDTDQPKNAAVANKFGVNGIPHIQFVTKDGKTIDKTMGGTTPKRFARTLKGVLKKVQRSRS